METLFFVKTTHFLFNYHFLFKGNGKGNVNVVFTKWFLSFFHFILLFLINKRKWKRKSFVTVDKTWLIIMLAVIFFCFFLLVTANISARVFLRLLSGCYFYWATAGLWTLGIAAAIGLQAHPRVNQRSRKSINSLMKEMVPGKLISFKKRSIFCSLRNASLLNKRKYNNFLRNIHLFHKHFPFYLHGP